MKPWTLLMGLFLFAGCKDQDKIPTPNPDFVYFQVAETTADHGDSYILPLTRAADIAAARAIIEGTTDPKIVLASITKDRSVSYYPNVDLENNRTWSWHVATFEGFYDNTIEIYDGWPEYVEENYPAWVENTKNQEGRGVIGFWSYTVVREVELEELQ